MTCSDLESSGLTSPGLNGLVESLSEQGIRADYRCADVLGRDLVPVETEKRY